MGILSGFGDGTFRPNAVVTKAELVTMFYRLLQQNGYDMEKLSEQLYGNYHDFYWEESAKLLELVNQERKKMVCLHCAMMLIYRHYVKSRTSSVP